MNTVSNRPYSRTERVADELHHILGNLFINEIFIPEAGLLTVTKVKVTQDLKLAKVYLSFLENKITVEDLIQLIRSKHILIRHYIGMKIKLKYIPELRFYHDDTMEHAEKIDKLINKIVHDD